jgi:putative MFS transporter
MAGGRCSCSANKALARLGAPPVDERLPMGSETAARTPVLALFAPEYRVRTVVMGVLWFCTSLVSFAFATWSPTLYVQVFHLTLKESLRYSALAGGIYLFVPLLFAVILDVLGRRGPAIASAALALAALIALIFVNPGQTQLVVTLITGGWVAAAAGSIILWPYTAEIFPTHLRATGLGLASSLARGASMLTPVVVGGTLAATGSIKGVFAFLAVCGLVTTVLWSLFARETARKSIEETSGEVPS